MGMFDSVYFKCPTEGCDGEVEVQSKAGECVLASYSPDAVPLVIALDIGGEGVWCRKCDRCYTVANVDGEIPRTIALKLTSDTCAHCGK